MMFTAMRAPFPKLLNVRYGLRMVLVMALLQSSRAGAGLAAQDNAQIATGPPGVTQNSPLDLVWSRSDPNGIPSDPQWWWQVLHPGTVPDVLELCNGVPNSPICTTQKTSLDLPEGRNRLYCSLDLGTKIPGHVNWFPVTNTNRINWGNFAKDRDYNFNSFPANGASLTFANYGSLGEEFDSREIIDHFQSPWWGSLRKAVDNKNFSEIHRLLTAQNGGQLPKAILLGLFGLDCSHICKSELHPLFAMAIELDPNPENNIWEIFVRNWGNEGFCSHSQHFVDFHNNQIKLILPNPSASRLNLLRHETRFFTNNNISKWPDVDLVEGQGALVTFQLPTPELRGFVEGEMHLRWKHKDSKSTQTVPITVPKGQEDDGDPEILIDQLVNQLPGQPGQGFEAVLSSDARDISAMRELLPTSQFHERRLHFVIIPSQVPQVRTANDELKMNLDQGLIE